MAAKDAAQKEKDSQKEQIYYSDTYKDVNYFKVMFITLSLSVSFKEMYEYRHVILPKEIAKKVPKGRLLTEHEWRHLGVQQSLGWVHFMIHEPGKSWRFDFDQHCISFSCHCRATYFDISSFT